MASTRRLAAILAADVAGYSHLMGADEEGTHERLQAHLRQLVDPKIKEHRGHIVKNTGDGLLAEFASVVDVTRCAAEVQRGMLDREPEMTDERRIRFRVGINLDDVIVEKHDIFGDGVNVAARLEALADNLTQAVDLFEHALALDPRSVEVQGLLAFTLTGRVLAGTTNSRAADIRRAVALVEQALAASPRSTIAHYAKGQLLRAEGRCEEAIPEFEAVVASNRNSTGALFHLGKCKIRRGL
jgi:tetratricopeptide (TPR) repeat protein